jgi:hypothetical protein
MTFGRVRPYDEQNLCMVYVGDGIAHGSVAKRGKCCSDRRGVAEPGAVVNIVGAYNRPGQLLDQVILFVGALRRAEHAHRVRAVPGSGIRYFPRHPFQRLSQVASEMCEFSSGSRFLVRFLFESEAEPADQGD